MAGKIVVKGARVHNLKNIDVEIPRDQLVVITGVSGSGKSSLAFDTLYAEGQRRYLESLAADARQFLQQMEKPDVDSIDGLSPAIAIEQKAGLSHPRSTVGTLTEIYDYLRLLFARVGQATCIQCGREIVAQTVEQISDQLLSLPEATRILVLAPIVTSPDPRPVLQELGRAGFARIKIDGEMHELSEEIYIQTERPHEIDLIVDRLVLRRGIERRLADSLEIASRFGRQIIKVEIVPEQTSKPAEALIFTQKFACIPCGISLPEITPGLFSFNRPQGACPACKGMGVESRPQRSGKNAETEPDTIPCRECKGMRLRKESLAVKLGGKSIADLTSISLADARDFMQKLKLDKKGNIVGEKLLHEIVGRIQFLIQLGLDYLTLDRSAVTLSGGEAQRVRLATQLGSSLAGVLYILDEPSIGLHQKDNAELLKLLKQLRDAGNSVVVVEHDQETIAAADHIIDIGPGAGVNGGQIVAQGTLAEIIEKFTEQLNLKSYVLYVQDYGAPTGYRLAVKHPERVQALIVQNGNAYEEGLRDFWIPIKAYWKERSFANTDALRKFLSLDSTRWQYTHGARNANRISPDNWLIDQALLDRPGNQEIQLQLFYDYGSNPPLYPQWHAYFRKYPCHCGKRTLYI